MVSFRVVQDVPDPEAVAAVYGDAFETDPAEFRTEVLPRHAARGGFTLALAEDDGDLLGFAYGYTGRRGQWFSEQVVEQLPHLADEWVGEHLEFVELGVLAGARGRGIGRRLHDLVLARDGWERALLCTELPTGTDERPATHLYRSAGWTLLSGEFLGDRALMGLEAKTLRR